MRRVPIVVRLYPKEVEKADLLQELKINKHDLDRELRLQSGKYAWWAALYSAAASRVELLQERLERLEARLFLKYSRNGHRRQRVGDIRKLVVLNKAYAKLKKRLRHWQDSERVLKYSALRGFEQRAQMLQSFSANTRKEKKAMED